MPEYNNKEKIIEHYDQVSPYYHALWGQHLHHGYWVTGKETKEQAQLALTQHLAQAAKIAPGSKILDVGCGFGASSIYLAQKYNAQTMGITISPVQVKMATEAAKEAGVNSQFLLMDADAITLTDQFDVVWSIESISHYKDKQAFFEKAVSLMKSGATLAIIDWFKKENLSDADYYKYIQPIDEGMLVDLHSMNQYNQFLKNAGLEVVQTEDISKPTAKTWDIASNVITNKKFWQLALVHGKEFVSFLRSFQAMRNGFKSETFVYGLIIAKKS